MEAVQPMPAGRKNVEATRGNDQSGETPAICLTVDDLIFCRREKEVAAAVTAERKERESVEKKAQRLQKKLKIDAEKNQKRMEI